MNINDETTEVKRSITDRGDRKLRVVIKKGGKKSDNSIIINKTPKRQNSNSILTDDDISEYGYINDSAYHTNRSFIQPPKGVSKLNLFNLGSANSNNTTLREYNEKVHETEITILSVREKSKQVSREFKVERIEDDKDIKDIKYKNQSKIDIKITNEKKGFDINNALYFIGGALSVGTLAYLLGKKTK